MLKISIGKAFLVASVFGSAASIATSSYFIYQKLSLSSMETIAPISSLIDTDSAKPRVVAIRPDLFGSKQEATKPMLSKLDIRLLGVMRSENAQDSKALLQLKSNPESFYGVGEEITKGVVLSEVHSSHIIINASGRAEVVYFPNQEPKLTRAIAIQQSSPSGVQTTHLSHNVSDSVTYQPPRVSQIINSPTGFNASRENLGAQLPKINDSVMQAALGSPDTLLKSGGLNLEAGVAKVGESSMVGQFLGLNAGDKVLSVDGVSIASLMSSPQKAMQLRGKTVNVAVMRNGQRSTLSVTIP